VKIGAQCAAQSKMADQDVQDSPIRLLWAEADKWHHLQL
jgi:hypothetical protein